MAKSTLTAAQRRLEMFMEYLDRLDPPIRFKDVTVNDVINYINTRRGEIQKGTAKLHLSTINAERQRQGLEPFHAKNHIMLSRMLLAMAHAKPQFPTHAIRDGDIWDAEVLMNYFASSQWRSKFTGQNMHEMLRFRAIALGRLHFAARAHDFANTIWQDDLTVREINGHRALVLRQFATKACRAEQGRTGELRTMTPPGASEPITRPATDTSPVLIYLEDRPNHGRSYSGAYAIIRYHRWLKANHPNPGPWLFHTNPPAMRSGLTSSFIQKISLEALKEAGIDPSYTSHSYKHASLQWYKKLGLSPDELARRGRHSDPATAAEHYLMRSIAGPQ